MLCSPSGALHHFPEGAPRGAWPSLQPFRQGISSRSSSRSSCKYYYYYVGKGQMGSALMGSLQISYRLKYCLGTNLSKYVNFVYLFHNLSECITFAATPLVLTPFVRNQVCRGQLEHTFTHFLVTSGG